MTTLHLNLEKRCYDITVGRGIKEGKVEFIAREGGEKQEISINDIVAYVKELVTKEK